MSREKKQQLLQQAAALNPVVLLGNKGLTPAVTAAIDQALNDHELIKIRFHSKDRDEKRQMTELICQQQQAIAIQSIGHVLVIYRKRKEERT